MFALALQGWEKLDLVKCSSCGIRWVVNLGPSGALFLFFVFVFCGFHIGWIRLVGWFFINGTICYVGRLLLLLPVVSSV